jgi:hypothetical protein
MMKPRAPHGINFLLTIECCSFLRNDINQVQFTKCGNRKKNYMPINA